VLQEIFGLPHGIVVKLAIAARRPNTVPEPEPVLALSDVPKMLVITQAGEKQTTWTYKPWSQSARCPRFPRKPAFLLVLYGKERDDGDIADHIRAAPLEEVAEIRGQPQEELDLPTVLRTLVTGNKDERLKLLLTLHKRMYHKPGDELNKLLIRAGIPVRVLALTADAVQMCEQCARWRRTGAVPATKTRLAARMNDLIYADLVFFDEGIFFFVVDDATRFTMITHTEFKDYTSVEKAFRRGWLSLFGPPRRIRSDKEGSLASDGFGVYCERLGIQRELVVAGDDGHSLLAV
jgi:hypothetical protein